MKSQPTVNICSLCGQPIPTNQVVVDGSDIICIHCFEQLGTCRHCSKSKRCEFHQNPMPIPKTIRQEIRKGPMIAVTDVQNPERVEKTCKSLCGCFSEEFGCLRQFNTCGGYDGR